MFKDLKNKLATQVNKTNQALFSTILPVETETNRSRVDSASSDVSQRNYVSPTRSHLPPSDIESEHGGDESDYERNPRVQQLLTIYKNKFTQLKKAYDEVERERDHVKTMLQNCQDSMIERQTELREKFKVERKAKDGEIEELKQKLKEQQENRIDEDTVKQLCEKNDELEQSFQQCQDLIKTQEDQRIRLIEERDQLSQRLDDQTNWKEKFDELQKKHQDELQKSKAENEILQEQIRQLTSTLNEFREKTVETPSNFDEELRKSKMENEILQERIRQLTSTVNEFRENTSEPLLNSEENQRLTSILKQTEENLGKSQKENETLQEEVRRLTSTVNELRETTAHTSSNSDEELRKSKTENEILQEEVRQLTSTVNELRENAVQLSSNSEENLQKSQKENESLQEEIGRLTSTVNELRENAVQLSSKSQEELRKGQAENEMLQEEVRQSTSTVNELRENAVQLSSKSQEELRKSKDENEKLQREIRQLTSTVNELCEKSAEISSNAEKDLQKSRAENESSRGEIRRLTSNLNELEEKIAEKSEEILRLNSTLKQIEENSRKTKNENRFLVEENRQLKESLAELEEKQNDDRRIFAEKSQKMSQLENEVKILTKATDEQNVRIENLNRENFLLVELRKEDERELTDRQEKIGELENSLKQTQESSAKLRKALQNLKETMTNGEKDNGDTLRLKNLVEESEQRLKDQEFDYNQKLRAMAKEMSLQIDAKEREFHDQLENFIHEQRKTENDLKSETEQRINNAEQRATMAEQHFSKLEEKTKQIQLDHYRLVQELQQQIPKKIRTNENSCQTSIEDVVEHDDPHCFTFEPTEVDYLKKIVLAYMTGTDRLTMAKVICAVLRYTEEQKSLIIEHEKIRQSRWMKSTR